MISLVIIAKNSQNTIRKAIESCEAIVNETIVILDENSTDDTERILTDLKIKVIRHKFENFSNQKNFGCEKARNHWILSLDSDEYLSQELIDEIKQIELNKEKIVAYSFPRLNYFFGKKVLHSNWSPEDDRHIRLFEKSRCKWEGVVHEKIQTNGIVKKCKNYLIHTPYTSVEEFIEKMNIYTSAETKQTNPLIDFVRRYFIHSGFKDGILGLFLCYLMVIYHITVGVKLWLKKHTSV